MPAYWTLGKVLMLKNPHGEKKALIKRQSLTLILLCWYMSGTFISSYIVEQVYQCEHHTQIAEGKFRLRSLKLKAININMPYKINHTESCKY